MTENTTQPFRRDLMNAALLAGAAALTGAATSLPPPDAPAGLWAASYWATKQRAGQDIQLAMYRKRAIPPPPARPPSPSCCSSTAPPPPPSPASTSPSPGTSSVPGQDDYSLMNVFARARLRRLDPRPRRLRPLHPHRRQLRHRQRRRRPRHRHRLHRRQETGQTTVHMLGESSGAIRAGAFAASPPRPHGPPRPRRLHLHRRRVPDPGQTWRTDRVLPHPQPSPPRPRHAREHLHPRPPRHLRPRHDPAPSSRRRSSTATPSPPAPTST